jgi:hypothetical protein
MYIYVKDYSRGKTHSLYNVHSFRRSFVRFLDAGGEAQLPSRAQKNNGTENRGKQRGDKRSAPFSFQ